MPSPPPKLEAALARAHFGEAIVHVGLGETAAVGRLAPTALSAIDGRLACDGAATTVRATFLTTDPAEHLGDVLRQGGPAAEWLGRMLWLVDGAAGPEPPVPLSESAAALPSLGGIHDRADLGWRWHGGRDSATARTPSRLPRWRGLANCSVPG